VRSVLRERHTHSGQQQIGRTIPPRLRNTRQFLSRTLIRCPKFRRSPRHRRKLKHYDIACNLECARRLNVVRSAITRGRNWLCYRQRPPEVTDWRGRTSPCRARSGHSDLVAARVQVGHAPECDFVPAPGNPRTGGAGRGAVVLTDRPTGPQPQRAVAALGLGTASQILDLGSVSTRSSGGATRRAATMPQIATTAIRKPTIRLFHIAAGWIRSGARWRTSVACDRMESGDQEP
jgi:hypothetical protein